MACAAAATVLCESRPRLPYQSARGASPRLLRQASRRGALALQTAHLVGGVSAMGLVAAVGAAYAAGPEDPQKLVRDGMQAFRENRVETSVELFDRAVQLRPSLHPYMWQRGLSLYYLGRYEEAARQFRDDVAVNPNDTEESIWAWLSEAQIVGPERATEAMLRVGRDPRPVMREAYRVFGERGDPEDILAAAGQDSDGGQCFYALLYHALWHEGHGNADEAQTSMLRAVGTTYAQGSGDYMADLARVHCKRRGWDA